MIAHITGTLLAFEDNAVVLDVSGVGYRIYVPADTLQNLSRGKKESSVSLFTHMAVRETSMDLYGFETTRERTLFELLIGVPGIGPKSALGVLSLAGVETLTGSIRAQDTSYLTRVSGIGKKSAEKIVLELKDKMPEGGEREAGSRQEDIDVLEALVALGYTQTEARSAVQKIPGNVAGRDERIKAALKLLG